jgi:hypothetical protein
MSWVVIGCAVLDRPADFAESLGVTRTTVRGPAYHRRTEGSTDVGGRVNARAILLMIVAFVLGALAAGSIGVRVIREVNSAEDATSLPPQNISTSVPPEAATYQVDPFETLISSTALVPTAIGVADTALSIEYDLITLSPHEGAEPIDLDHIYPSAWVVETVDGSVGGGPANPKTRAARFDVPDGFSTRDIRSVTITEARSPYPIEIPFTVSGSDTVADIGQGVRVELLDITDQGSSFTVQIAIEIEDPASVSLIVSGDGPGWRPAVLEAEGSPRLDLTWIGDDLPDEIPLLAEGTMWVPIVGHFPVNLEGLG